MICELVTYYDLNRPKKKGGDYHTYTVLNVKIYGFQNGVNIKVTPKQVKELVATGIQYREPVFKG